MTPEEIEKDCAPERIWIAGDLAECGYYYPSAVEAEGEHGGWAVEYIRADLHDAEITRLTARVSELEARLEIDHCWQWQAGKRVRRELTPEERLTFPDGITCRDDTIGLIEDDRAEAEARGYWRGVEDAVTAVRRLDTGKSDGADLSYNLAVRRCTAAIRALGKKA